MELGKKFYENIFDSFLIARICLEKIFLKIGITLFKFSKIILEEEQADKIKKIIWKISYPERNSKNIFCYKNLKAKNLSVESQDKAQKIEIIDYIFSPSLKATALHPMYQSIISYPPEGYKFVSSPLSHCSFNIDNVAKEIISGKFIKTPENFRSFFRKFVANCKQENISYFSLMRFLKSRPLDKIFSVPTDNRIVFVPTFPLYLGPNDWIIFIEDYTTLFFPFVKNGETYRIDVRRLPEMKILKNLLIMENCKAIITHVENTYNTLKFLFNSEEISKKIKFCPVAIPPPGLKEDKKINREKINLLFTNSFKGAPTQFFLRGGREVMHAFDIMTKKYSNLYLTILSPIPWKYLRYKERQIIKKYTNTSHLRIIETFLPFNEISKIFSQSHIYLIPAYRIHVISTIQAMAYGMVVIASDGWGFSEFIQDRKTGFLVKGVNGIRSWVDENGILKEDYRNFEFSVNQKLIHELVEKFLFVSKIL
ncbi:MAG: glycosyltransferase [Candidatus Omnitrophica bacterium]|nr:glycosyltransferase [Candidatus Omnitrophota bacterium]